jgi:hypothetical protein
MKPLSILKTTVIGLTIFAFSALLVGVNADTKPKTEDYLQWILAIVEDIQVKVGDVLFNLESEADSIRAEVGSVMALQEVVDEKVDAVADQVNFGLPLVHSKTEKAEGTAPAGGYDPVAYSNVFNETGRTGPGQYHVVVAAGALPPGANVSVSAFWQFDDGTQGTIPICSEANLDIPATISAELLVCEFTADGYVITAATADDSDFEYSVRYASTVTVP